MKLTISNSRAWQNRVRPGLFVDIRVAFFTPERWVKEENLWICLGTLPAKSVSLVAVSQSWFHFHHTTFLWLRHFNPPALLTNCNLLKIGLRHWAFSPHKTALNSYNWARDHRELVEKKKRMKEFAQLLFQCTAVQYIKLE